MFSGVYWNQPICPSNSSLEQEDLNPRSFSPKNVCVSVCAQNTSFCQSTGRGTKSHLVTDLVFTCRQYKS